MARFFIDDNTFLVEQSCNATITGENANHIAKSLRMTKGEKLTLCDGFGFDYNCTIETITKESVLVSIDEKLPSISEPNLKVTIFQGMPKGDKLDTIVQKCVEVGAYSFVPVITKRCVSRPDEKSAVKKVARLNKISLEASKQSGRGIVPTVCDVTNFNQILNTLSSFDLVVIFYEGGGDKIKDIFESYYNEHKSYENMNIAIIIGPEGGLDGSEVEKIVSLGGKCATLGTRILRTETAPISALSIILYQTGNV